MKKNYTDQEYMYFAILNRVAEFIFSYASQDFSSQNFLADTRNNNVDPFFLQTKKGLVLKICSQDKYPLSLCSIFGEWQCFGIGKNQEGWKKIMPSILKKMRAKKLEIKSKNFIYYAICEIDELLLPEPIFRNRNEFLPNGQIIKKWICLNEIYKKRMKGAKTQRKKNNR